VAFLEDRVVLVTGAGRGLGRAHALELARQGATVVVNDLGVTVDGEQDTGPSAAEMVVSEIERAGGSAMADASSVSDWHGIERLVERIVERFGHLDAVVNNAGFLRDRMLTSMNEEDFDRVLEVHAKGTFVVTRHACAHWRALAKAGHEVTGRIVNTTSGTGLWGNVGQTNYAAAKSAVIGITMAVALEMERYGVSANAISPIASTRMTAGVASDDGDHDSWRAMDPSNASPVVAWLVSEGSGWLSGAVLRIEGNSVCRVDGHRIAATYRSTSGAALTPDELQIAARRLYGTLPIGLAGREQFDLG
jgi:NAD(P)-dependent dehydrogenase (short-subunit alcohol dehydrogenase family)